MSSRIPAIPMVDISGLYSEDARDRESVAKELGNAASEVGFLYVSGHRVEPSYIEGLRTAAKKFFAQPLDEKMKYYIGLSRNHKGYVPIGEEKVVEEGEADKKEAFDIGFEIPQDHPLVKAQTPLLGPNRWPPIPDFQEKVKGYYDQIFALGNTLLGGFSLALGMEENALNSMVTFPPSKMRMIHYPYDDDAKDTLGCGEHTDFEWFTILLADAPGLEVLSDSGEWLDAPPIPGTFLVNIGDVLEVMTAGYFTATAHRVRPVKQERYSFPFFYSSDYHTEVKPLPQFSKADTGNYPAMKVGDHIWSQEIQAFSYLKNRISRGDLKLPANSRTLGTFGNISKTAKT